MGSGFESGQSGSRPHFPDNDSGLTRCRWFLLAFIPNDRLCVRIASSWPTSDFHVSVSRTVLHMLALSRLKGKPGYCPSFLPWVFSKGAETAPFSSTCNSARGMLHQEMGAGGRMPPPSPRETILSLSWYSTSERVWQDRAPLPAAITSSVTPAVGSPSFLVSCSLTPASCTSFHQQHPNPHLGLCFGGIQTETELHLL